MTTSGGINLTKLLLAEGHLELDLVLIMGVVPSTCDAQFKTQYPSRSSK